MKLFSLLIAQFFMMLSRCVVLPAVGQMTTADIAGEVDAFYDRTQIQPLRDEFLFARYGQKRKLPKGSGSKTIRMNKWPVMPTQTIPLTEGVNPDPQKSSKTVVEATASLYGGYVEITEEVDVYRQDPVAQMYQERMGWQGADTLNEITRDALIGGTNVVRANSVAGRVNIITKVAVADLKKVARTLRNNKAPFFKKQIDGSNRIGSSAVSNAWVLVVHGDVQADLEEISTGIYKWTRLADYANQSDIDPGEVGALGNFRVMATTLAKVWEDAGAAVSTSGLVTTGGSNIDVYCSLALAPDAFGCVDVADGMKSIRKPASQIGGALDLYSTIGWKSHYVSKIIDGDRIVRLESGATA